MLSIYEKLTALVKLRDDYGDELTEWEYNFIGSIGRQVANEDTTILTANQVEKIEQIYIKRLT